MQPNLEQRKQARTDALIGEQIRNLIHLDTVATMRGEEYERLAATVVDLILNDQIPNDRVQSICLEYPDIQQRVKRARSVTKPD